MKENVGERMSKTDCLSSGSLNNYIYSEPRTDQSLVTKLEFHLSLTTLWQEPKYLAHHQLTHITVGVKMIR